MHPLAFIDQIKVCEQRGARRRKMEGVVSQWNNRKPRPRQGDWRQELRFRGWKSSSVYFSGVTLIAFKILLRKITYLCSFKTKVEKKSADKNKRKLRMFIILIATISEQFQS